MAAHPRSTDLARQGANLLLAAAQVLASYWTTLTGLGIDIGERSAQLGPTPVTPASYAFVVWGPIFAASLAYAFYQAAPSRRADPILRGVGWWTAAAFSATVVWSIAAQSGAPDAPLAFVLALIAAPLLVALLRLTRAPRPPRGAARWLVTLPVGLFAGWASVATFANAATALRDAGAMSDAVGAMLIVGAGVLGASMTVASRGNVEYALVVVWGLIAVLVTDILQGFILSALAARWMTLLVLGALVVMRLRAAAAPPRAMAGRGAA